MGQGSSVADHLTSLAEGRAAFFFCGGLRREFQGEFVSEIQASLELENIIHNESELN